MGMALTVEACSIKSNIRIQCHCQDSPRMTGLGLSIVTIMPSMEAPSRLWANHGAILRESMLGTISGMRIRSGTILVSRMPRSASEAIHATYTIYVTYCHVSLDVIWLLTSVLCYLSPVILCISNLYFCDFVY